MSNLIYIPDCNLFINLDQVVNARYEPAHDYVDDEFARDGAPVRIIHAQEILIITTTALEVRVIDGFDGVFAGAASKSQEIKLSGEYAILVLNSLVDDSRVLRRQPPVTDFPAGSLSATA
jgi:hypothetical protein